MPNYNQGTDQGSLASHPLYDSSFNESAGGPYKITYNGFIRPNTGVYDRDGTGDSARNAWHYYLQNLDLTISKHDCTAAPTANKVVLRDADGGIEATALTVGNYAMTDQGIYGVVSGGRF